MKGILVLSMMGRISIVFIEVIFAINPLLKVYCLVPLTSGHTLYTEHLSQSGLVCMLYNTHHFVALFVKYHDTRALPCDKYFLMSNSIRDS